MKATALCRSGAPPPVNDEEEAKASRRLHAKRRARCRRPLCRVGKVLTCLTRPPTNTVACAMPEKEAACTFACNQKYMDEYGVRRLQFWMGIKNAHRF